MGKNGTTIDILLIGKALNKEYLLELVGKVEQIIKRKIRYLVLQPDEAEEYLKKMQPYMLLWKC